MKFSIFCGSEVGTPSAQICHPTTCHLNLERNLTISSAFCDFEVALSLNPQHVIAFWNGMASGRFVTYPSTQKQAIRN
ncbi:hypothetical protein CEXT_32521 [Caerostris extrusa]|uniref:Uncharacterized protein n=1 Tax=Caerostris extrusa TaxID=172846 RepID=A0AAV4VA44_CAEEX|nr:hypothetical protein CEXT_32521 [Caerostris extrusa]